MTKVIYTAIASLLIGSVALIIHATYIAGVSDGVNQLHQCQYDINYFITQMNEARDELAQCKAGHP